MSAEHIGGRDPEITSYLRDLEYLHALESGDDGWADNIEASRTDAKPQGPVVQLLQDTAVRACVDGRLAS